jgi:hypothetical protein
VVHVLKLERESRSQRLKIHFREKGQNKIPKDHAVSIADCQQLLLGEPVLVTLVSGHDLVLITCLESLYLRRFMFAFRCLCLRPTY